MLSTYALNSGLCIAQHKPKVIHEESYVFTLHKHADANSINLMEAVTDSCDFLLDATALRK